jgi:hypothetical protein
VTILSPNFDTWEFTNSQVATRLNILNEPDPEQWTWIQHLCRETLEPIRILLGVPVKISSGYRCPELNSMIGGAPNSQHQALNECAAADFQFKLPFKSHEESIRAGFDRILSTSIAINYDQIILEFDRWIHISWVESGPRRQVRVVSKVGGRTKYEAV